MTNTLFGPDPMEEAVDRYVRWVKSQCRTIADAQKTLPGRSAPGISAWIGGYNDDMKVKPGEFIIKINGTCQAFSLKKVWQRCGVTEVREEWVFDETNN